MNNKQLAAALNLSPNTTKKYPQEKRQQIIRDITAGVKPHIMQLVGEVAAACYKAQHYTGSSTNIDIRADVYEPFFNVWHGNDYIISCEALNTVNLAGALAKIEELCK